MYLLIDNYDSFTWNVFHMIAQNNVAVDVIRNDKINESTLVHSKYKGIIVSPGPGIPSNAGKTMAIIKNYFKKIPILGICLGHQAIANVFGAKIIKSNKIMHGRTDVIEKVFDSRLFNTLPKKFIATRYHSLIIKKNTLPKELKIIATNAEGIVMGIEHENFPIFGLQFHPESIESEFGSIIFKNFIGICNNYES